MLKRVVSRLRSRLLVPLAGLAWLMATPQIASADPTPAAPPERPAARLVGCSTYAPVCAHAVAGTTPSAEALHATLTSAESMLEFLRRSGLPTFAPNDRAGGGPELDVYLDANEKGGHAVVEPRSAVGAHDVASAFVVAEPHVDGCRLASNVARATAAAVLLQLSPGAHASTIALGASQLAALAAPCPTVEFAAVDAFQRAPEGGLTRSDPRQFHGGALWLEHLDATYGRPFTSRLFTDLVALTSQRTAADALDLAAEPDLYDVLRRVFSALGTSLDEALSSFAVARAFVGSRSDGAHIADTERFGDLGRVRFDWRADLAGLPRRLQTRPLEPTGASYLWLETVGATEKEGLVVSIECEATYAFRWALVTVDAEGKELGRHIGGRFGEDTTQLTLANLAGVAAVLVVGTSLGHDDRERAFDPEDRVSGEAVCEVSLHRS